MTMNESNGINSGKKKTGARNWLSSRFHHLKSLLLIVIMGVLVGKQIYNPSKRFIEALIAFALIFVMWNLSTVSALLFFIIIYPYPFGISLGHSNMIFLVIIFNIYLLRVSLKLETFKSDKTFNLPIGLTAASYILSLSNFDFDAGLGQVAFINTTSMFSAIMLFYLVINMVDDEVKLRMVINSIIVSITLVLAFTLTEMLFPGKTIIPAWLYSEHKVGLIVKGLRMEGPFHDFELLAEFLSLSIPLMIFMVVRSKRLLMRMIYTLLLVTCLFLMFATITRGAFITLVIGLMYMGYTCRKDLDIVKVAAIAGAFVALIFILEAFVARYTVAGSLFDRLVKTSFESGIIPKNRHAGWTQGIERALWHPLLGNGPALDWSKGVSMPVYPHNGYLFILDMTGLLGLSAYLLLLYRLTKTSLITIRDSIVSAPLPQAFMKLLNVWLVMFMIDQIKIEYLRNNIYIYYVWLFFALIPATRNVILKMEREQPTHAPPS